MKTAAEAAMVEAEGSEDAESLEGNAAAEGAEALDDKEARPVAAEDTRGRPYDAVPVAAPRMPTMHSRPIQRLGNTNPDLATSGSHAHSASAAPSNPTQPHGGSPANPASAEPQCTVGHYAFRRIRIRAVTARRSQLRARVPQATAAASAASTEHQTHVMDKPAAVTAATASAARADGAARDAAAVAGGDEEGVACGAAPSVQLSLPSDVTDAGRWKVFLKYGTLLRMHRQVSQCVQVCHPAVCTSDR